MTGDFLTVSQVARLKSRSARTVRMWIEAGTLPAIMPGNEYLIARMDAEAFVVPPRGRPKEC